MKRKRRREGQRERKRAEGKKWKGRERTNGESGVMDCRRAGKRWGVFTRRGRTVGTRAETELQPSGQGEPCEEPVEIKILQAHCYRSSARHAMHILFEEQSRRSPHSSLRRCSTVHSVSGNFSLFLSLSLFLHSSLLFSPPLCFVPLRVPPLFLT